MRLFLALLLVSFGAMAAAENWEDLRIGDEYKLTQSFQLPIKANRGSLLDLMKGEKVRLLERIAMDIPGASLILYKFRYQNCPGMQMVTDLELVAVEDTSPVVEVGAMIQERCELYVYLETKDFYTASLFE